MKPMRNAFVLAALLAVGASTLVLCTMPKLGAVLECRASAL
jgi:hypothetical protein